jgi:hypothetical protein
VFQSLQRLRRFFLKSVPPSFLYLVTCIFNDHVRFSLHESTNPIC